jgi:hypothetical protein
MCSALGIVVLATWMVAAPCKRCPTQRSFTDRTASTPGVHTVCDQGRGPDLTTERHCREGIREVVDGVGQQRDGVADDENHQLKDGRREQRKQADLQCTDSSCARFKGIIDRIRSIVGVWHEESVEESTDPGRMRVTVRTVVMVVVVMFVFVQIVVVGHAPIVAT